MKKKNKVVEQELDYEIGSGNVFADLGLENAENELLKSDLTAEISNLIKKKKLTPTHAAKILGVDQPRLSSLLRGNFDLFSIEMLMHFLNEAGFAATYRRHQRPGGALEGLGLFFAQRSRAEEKAYA